MAEIPSAQSTTETAASKPPAGGAPEYWVHGAGPLLVYIAGLDGTGELFFKQSRRLPVLQSPDIQVARGAGLFVYEDLADDVAALISANSDTRATIVGESFGGTVALSFCSTSVDGRTADHREFLPSVPWPLPDQACSVARSRRCPFGISWAAPGGFSFLGLHMDGVSAEGQEAFLPGSSYGEEKGVRSEASVDCQLRR